MKINFQKLIADSGEQLTISQLAAEMAMAGVFKNKKSAYDMIRYHISGKAKSADFALVEYLSARFKKQEQEIIEWK